LKPFIIWTWRRTGGTNLSEFLFELSSFDEAEDHEPFNPNRMFGAISKEFEQNEDPIWLEQQLQLVLETRPLLKHCLEIIPNQLNRTLAEVTTALGYEHLFLFRERASERLLSFHLARETGVWDTRNHSEYPTPDAIEAACIPTNRLIQHEIQCREKMSEIFLLLLSNQQSPHVISYEGLFLRKDEECIAELQDIIFGLCGINVDRQLLDTTLLDKKRPGKKILYHRFSNYQNFLERADQLERYFPAFFYIDKLRSDA
jgi:hypothetical protein